MIYLHQKWAPVLLNYVCHTCFSPLRIMSSRPACPLHGETMWLHKSRRQLFRFLRWHIRQEKRRNGSFVEDLQNIGKRHRRRE